MSSYGLGKTSKIKENKEINTTAKNTEHKL